MGRNQEPGPLLRPTDLWVSIFSRGSSTSTAVATTNLYEATGTNVVMTNARNARTTNYKWCCRYLSESARCILVRPRGRWPWVLPAQAADANLG